MCWHSLRFFVHTHTAVSVSTGTCSHYYAFSNVSYMTMIRCSEALALYRQFYRMKIFAVRNRSTLSWVDGIFMFFVHWRISIFCACILLLSMSSDAIECLGCWFVEAKNGIYRYVRSSFARTWMELDFFSVFVSNIGRFFHLGELNVWRSGHISPVRTWLLSS